MKKTCLSPTLSLMRWLYLLFLLSSSALFSDPVRLSLISNTLFSSSNPQVAMNASGQSVIVWQQSQTRNRGSFQTLYGSINLGTPFQITFDSFNATLEDVAIDGNGKAVVVYVQQPSQNALPQVFLATFSNSSSITIQQITKSDSTHFASSNPQIALNSTGKMVIPYVQATQTSTGTKGVVYAYVNPNTPGASTFTKTLSDPITNPLSEVIQPVVAINTNGAAIVAWNQPTQQHGVTMDMVFVNTLSSTNQWRGTKQITQAIQNKLAAAIDPDVAIADDESALVTYLQNTTFFNPERAYNMVYVAAFSSGTLKSTSQISSGISPFQNVSAAEVAMSSNGWAIISYLQTMLIQNQTAIMTFATSRASGGTFSTPSSPLSLFTSTFRSVIVTNSSGTQLTIDTMGRASILWLQNVQGSSSTQAAIFLRKWAQNGPTTNSPIQVSTIQPAILQATQSPSLAMNNNNHTLIVWNQSQLFNSRGYIPSIFYSQNP